MGKKVKIKLLVEGGKADTKSLGPKLGPYKVNISKIAQDINEKTKEFTGMTVPVEIELDIETKEYTITVGIPPTSQLILKELGKDTGAHATGKEVIGDLPMEKIIKIALIKKPQLLAKSLKAAVKTILGTCVSMGVNVDGKDPRIVTKEVDQGLYDDLLKKYEEEWSK